MMVDTKDWTTPVEALAGDLEHVWTATLKTTDPFNPVSLDLASTADPDAGRIVSCAVTYDRTRAPIGTVTMTVAGLDEAPLAGFDPMDGAILDVSAGYAPPGSALDVHPLGRFDVDRIASDEAGRTVITGATIDARIIDMGDLDTPYDVVDDPRDHMGSLAVLAGVPLQYGDLGLYDPTNEYQLVTDRAWDAIAGIMSVQGWHLEVVGLGQLWVQRDGLSTRPLVAQLRTGPTGTITRRNTDRSRDVSATLVRTVHEWRDPDGAEHTVTGRAVDTIRDRAGNRRAATIRSGAPTTQAAANREARQVLDRMASRSRRTTIATIAHYWIRPDDVLEWEAADYDPAVGALSRGSVDAVTHASDGTSTLTLRPILDWTIGDVATTYATIADVVTAFPTIADLVAGPTP